MTEITMLTLFILNNLFFLGRVGLSLLIFCVFLGLLKKSNIYNTYIVFTLQSTIICLSLVLILSFFPLISVTLWVLLILIYIYLTILIYILLYAWRKLEIFLSSLLKFSCNLFIFNLFLLGLSNLVKGLPTAIYVENLSVFSIYKYTLFLCALICTILVYVILKKYFTNHLNKLEILTFPYLKEEVRIFLYTWNDELFGSICSYLIDFLYKYSLVRYIYFSMHFFLFYLIRILQALFFCNFVFFHGDFRWNLYLLPLSFLSWLLKFFEYYFNTFLKGTDEYIRSLLNVTLKNPLKAKKVATAYFLSGNDLIFEITTVGFAEGFSTDNLVYLGTNWLEMSHIMHFFNAYEKNLAYINKLINFLRLLSWLGITYMFYFASTSTSILLTWKFFAIFRSFHSSSVPRYAPPREIYKIKTKAQADLEEKTDGAYKRKHYGVIDTDKVNEKGEVSFEAGLTHGPGSTKNPSKHLSNEDVEGKDRPQKGTFPKKETFIDPERFLDKKVDTDFMNKTDVKTNMDKYTFKSDKSDKDPS